MVAFQPEGWHTVTPRIVVRDPEGVVNFIKKVFDAHGEYCVGRPAEMKIGDSVVMVSGGERAVTPAFLYVYVADADAVYRRAGAAGATTLEEPMDMPYGDRRAMVKDSWGNIWQIATHKEDLSAEDVRTRLRRNR
ncbi:MAG TPA: VOC family protein [Steroidobacteraceae bacterium]|jgi:PhnB protein|nr:VOC family protein [Steroidobacteraceae bacterium]